MLFALAGATFIAAAVAHSGALTGVISGAVMCTAALNANIQRYRGDKAMLDQTLFKSKLDIVDSRREPPCTTATDRDYAYVKGLASEAL